MDSCSHEICFRSNNLTRCSILDLPWRSIWCCTGTEFHHTTFNWSKIAVFTDCLTCSSSTSSPEVVGHLLIILVCSPSFNPTWTCMHELVRRSRYRCVGSTAPSTENWVSYFKLFLCQVKSKRILILRSCTAEGCTSRHHPLAWKNRTSPSSALVILPCQRMSARGFMHFSHSSFHLIYPFLATETGWFAPAKHAVMEQAEWLMKKMKTTCFSIFIDQRCWSRIHGSDLQEGRRFI